MLVVLSHPLLEQSPTQPYIMEMPSWGTGLSPETGGTWGCINLFNSLQGNFSTVAVSRLPKVCPDLSLHLSQGTADSRLTEIINVLLGQIWVIHRDFSILVNIMLGSCLPYRLPFLDLFLPPTSLPQWSIIFLQITL